MNWLVIIIVYYVLGYLLAGRILVDIFDLVTWDTMIGLWLGCCIGHYMGKIDRIGYGLG